MTGSILIGIDSSTPSRSALTWGIERALNTGHSLELLHVIDAEGIDRESSEWHQLRQTAVQLLRDELQFARELAPGLQITTNLADGRAEDALVRRSSAHDMLVVGTHKTGFIYGRSFGSRFLDLALRAHCDVAFIPDQAGSKRRGVVAAADSSPVGAAIVRFAAAEAAASGQDLTLVGATRTEAVRGCALAVGLVPMVNANPRVLALPRAEALIEASANASLLVIGRARRARSNTATRAVNHNVLVNMSCPVVVVDVA